MPPAELETRVEEASLNAWPALQQMLLDGWVLRFGRGFTKRANSIVPLYASAQPPLDKIRFCEDLYAKEHLKTIFRLTTVRDNAPLDELLAKRGYASIEPTLVLAAPLAGRHWNEAPRFQRVAGETWLAAYAHHAAIPASAQALHAMLLRGIRTEHLFGAIVTDDAAPGAAALGLAVLERELVGLFDIVTDPAQRRRGHARGLINSLLGWGAQRGAEYAYLQVVESNAAARALYEELGFTTLYRYWYRVSPATAA
jgi:ribosomal protein S18 acetylase RimI-like enzyme